ncbi:MAG: YihY/virulence factor BrkB family protein [Ignavibacteriales bacterium]|nr:YihY/virulence factor BrkB family protein [Ignavibacteriales bacterium]MCF8305845.1 YihY/virulence factor BrkB family protein [Ignavibacteriales bacterium]MCF8315567.1 YihY/virulence factor BrkB family protein [Ignavibacteriales bacterium]MCF8436903.1 YihY/virulence factor BrkB family protein [Ignavibacteriales bacterium]
MLKFKIFRALLGYFPVRTLKNLFHIIAHYFGGIYTRMDKNHLFLTAGGLAFSIFICIIPLLLIILSILGNLLESTEVENQIQMLINMMIPYPDYAEYTSKILMSRLPDVVEYKNSAAVIGIVGLLFASSGLFSSMRTVLNSIFGVTTDKHALIGKLRDFGMVLLLIIFLFFSILILPVFNLFTEIADRFSGFEYLRLDLFWNVVISITSTLLIFLIFFLFYYIIPYEKLKRRVPLVSAFWTTVLWELARYFFGYYINHFSTYNRIYGTYALLAGIAFWIYYASVLFILGAEIGQLYRERKVLPVVRKDSITERPEDFAEINQEN